MKLKFHLLNKEVSRRTCDHNTTKNMTRGLKRWISHQRYLLLFQRTGSQHPVPGDLTPSSGFLGHCTHEVHRHACREKNHLYQTHIYSIMKLKLNLTVKKSMLQYPIPTQLSATACKMLKCQSWCNYCSRDSAESKALKTVCPVTQAFPLDGFSFYAFNRYSIAFCLVPGMVPCV